jgi:hypothetical protein
VLWVIGLPVVLHVARPVIGRHIRTAYRAVSFVGGVAEVGFGLAVGWAVVGI